MRTGATEASRVGKIVSVAKHCNLVPGIIVYVLQGSMANQYRGSWRGITYLDLRNISM